MSTPTTGSKAMALSLFGENIMELLKNPLYTNTLKMFIDLDRLLDIMLKEPHRIGEKEYRDLVAMSGNLEGQAERFRKVDGFEYICELIDDVAEKMNVVVSVVTLRDCVKPQYERLFATLNAPENKIRSSGSSMMDAMGG